MMIMSINIESCHFPPSVERTGLEQAVHEAKNQQYADEYDSLEDFRKDLYSNY